MRVVVDKLIEGVDINGFQIVDIPMPYYQRQKSRQKIALEGIEIIIMLQNRIKLKPYSIIFLSDQNRTVYRIVPAQEEIIEIYVKDKLEALLVGHTLGNMHFPVGFEGDAVTTLYDESIELKLKKKGFQTLKKVGIFIEVSESEHHAH